MRRSAPAALRNQAPILEILRGVLPSNGLVLEVASGTGEHVAYFARHLPALDWQPSDPMTSARASIAAWIEHDGLANIRPPIAVDATSSDWPITTADAILCINMVHISPWEATIGLMKNSGKLLPPGAPLVLYGPYIRVGIETAPSNLAFDEDLKRRNTDWGLRRLEDVAKLAKGESLLLDAIYEMPANNIMVAFRRG